MFILHYNKTYMSFNVVSQISRFCETLFTVGTFIRSLFGMLSYMNFKNILSRKFLTTIWKVTLKWFLKSMETSYMIFKMPNCCETYIFVFTFFTLIWLYPFMTIIMILKTRFIKVKLITPFF